MKLLTTREVDALLGVRRGRTEELIRQGLLPAVRLGRQVRVEETSLRAWITAGGQAWPGGWRRAPQSGPDSPSESRR